MKRSKTNFCPIPWLFQAVRSNGDLRVCCQANVSANRGLLFKHESKTPYNASSDSLEEARNSDVIKKMRQNILNGIWDDNCKRCKDEESNGLRSRRIYENEQWDFNESCAQRVTSINGKINTSEVPIKYYDLRFGNHCNLACRMCGPADSSGWYKDWVLLKERYSFNDTHGKVNLTQVGNKLTTQDYNWHNSPSFWKQLQTNMNNIMHIYMAGGEPLLIKNHYQFLRECVKQGRAKKIILEYNTNCTIVPNLVTELWSHFKQVRIGASIDGFGDYIEYQRYPLKWKEVLKNLYLINQLPSNIVCWFAFTVTSYNIFHLTDFMKWKLIDSKLHKFNSSRKRPIITPHMAHKPYHLNIRALPRELKIQVLEKFKNFNAWIMQEPFSSNLKDESLRITDNISNYMMTQNYNNDYWPEFCSFTTKLDKIRKQNFLSLQPNFKEFF